MPPSVMSRPAPARPLLILGPSPTAPDLALRRLLRAKLAGQALGIIDYQGVLARHLTPRNKGHMHKSPVLWCDLSNRRRPIALFRFQRTPGMKQALRAFLDICVGAWSEPIAAHAIDATVELAYRLAENGSVGLASLARSLQRPELARSVGRNGGQELDLERLVAMLDWMLRFPSVWALSEGNNRIDVARALAGGGILWIEMPAGHFERLEHTVVSWMVDAMLMDALLSRGHGTDEKLSPVILYGLPPSCPLPMATASGNAKHVGLFSFSGKKGLPVAARRWLEAGADCWIAGSLGQLPDSNHTDWLQDVERKRVQELEPGQVWVRSGLSGKAVTVLVRPHEATESVVASLRLQSLRCLKQSPIKQFSSAHARGEAPVAKNSDLFATMCAKETLYAGWFRVKTHNRRSHGSDQVTIEQFGSKLDAQLEHLATELSEGRYRCRPLRTVRIPKADGDFRVIKIACVRDRVVQAACLQLIEPLFDARFSPTSFAYRPGRGAHHAIALARSNIRAGKVFALTADIRKCFDSIDHDILLRLVGDVVGDHDVIQLLRRWLTSDVIDFMDVVPAELGVHQGEAISPLLANIYLDPMDKEFERAGFTFVRYADRRRGAGRPAVDGRIPAQCSAP